MQDISLIKYSPDIHIELLEKWLVDKDLMHDWGLPAFKVDEIASWAYDPKKVILMVQNKKNGDIVGFVNLYEWDRRNAKASMGILIDPKYQNQGFGKIAIEELNKYAFKEMKLKRINLYVEADNKRSKYVMEKMGYILDRFDSKKHKYYYHLEEK